MLGVIFAYYHSARLFRREEAVARARKAFERLIAAAAPAAGAEMTAPPPASVAPTADAKMAAAKARAPVTAPAESKRDDSLVALPAPRHDDPPEAQAVHRMIPPS